MYKADSTQPPPQGSIYGRVTKYNTPASGLKLMLRYYNGSAWSTLLTTYTNADGSYSFAGAPSLPPDHSYYVRYSNTEAGSGAGYLWNYWAPRFKNYIAGTAFPGGDFDVGDVTMVSPANNASVSLPAQFCWNARGVVNDVYRVEVYDPSTDQVATTLWDAATCATLNSLPAGWTSGRQYRWSPQVTIAGVTDPYSYGDAYYYRNITINYALSALGLLPTGAPLVLPSEAPPDWP